MQVNIVYRNDPERGLTDPLPELEGRKFIFRLYTGDVNDPISCCGSADWFGPNYPKHVIRFNSKIPLPFIAWKWPFMNKAGYLGFKLYGVDAEQYKNWIPVEEVYDGSQAVCFSFRPFASLK